MRKGIFTKDVEDQAAIAKRLSHAVNDGLAGTIAMASQSAQNAKRVRELQKTMDSQQKRLQSVTEPFKGLSREQMTEILMMAQRFKQQNQEKENSSVLNVKTAATDAIAWHGWYESFSFDATFQRSASTALYNAEAVF